MRKCYFFTDEDASKMIKEYHELYKKDKDDKKEVSHNKAKENEYSSEQSGNVTYALLNKLNLKE